MTYQDLHCWMIQELSDAGLGNARQEAIWIAENALDDFATRLLTRGEAAVPPDVEAAIAAASARRAAGEPLQYILGSTEFYGLDLETGPGVLIPRPETECLVDRVLGTAHPEGPILDLCCGSGAIALALAANLSPARQLVATDRSAAAVSATRRNARRLGLDVEVRRGDLFASLRGPFAVIVTNPPYVSDSEYAALDTLVRDHEPSEALRAGEDGLHLIRRIVTEAPRYLVPGGHLYCEIGAAQGPAAGSVFAAAGFSEVQVGSDRAGRDRIVSATRAGCT